MKIDTKQVLRNTEELLKQLHTLTLKSEYSGITIDGVTIRLGSDDMSTSYSRVLNGSVMELPFKGNLKLLRKVKGLSWFKGSLYHEFVHVEQLKVLGNEYDGVHSDDLIKSLENPLEVEALVYELLWYESIGDTFAMYTKEEVGSLFNDPRFFKKFGEVGL